MTTLLYFPLVHDTNGNNVNPDMNTSSGSVDCHTCQKHWTYISANGNTDYTEWTGESWKTKHSE